MLTPIRISLSFLAVLIFTGCGPRESSPFIKLSDIDARKLAVEIASAREHDLANDVADAFNGESPRNVLVLSGGDARGAHGAGILRGWCDAPGGRPTFDVVTGVSTGALMATAAFLGAPEDDESVRQIYTEVKDSDIFTGPFTFGKPDSIYDTKPLKQLLEKHITWEILRFLSLFGITKDLRPFRIPARSAPVK